MPAAPAVDYEVAWKPHQGSQALFLSCPFRECLYTGTRGPGKTDALLMDFAQHVGLGFGPAWRGVLFREEATQLEEVRSKAQRWFPRIFPTARYVGAPKDKWVFADGAELLFRHAKRRSDYDKYHGWEVPWIGWEELTNWSEPALYHLLKSINRTTHPGVPLKYRATCNPYGKGHNWVKAYFIDPAEPGEPFVPQAEEIAELLAEAGVELVEDASWQAVTLHGHYSENRALMDTDPNYRATIARAASNPEQAKAWLADDWDIVSGGMFDDVWDRTRHVLPVFEPPPGWHIYRAYDDGSTKPFSLGWWLKANGEEATLPDGSTFCPPPGSLIRWAEYYGWDGRTPNVGLKLAKSEIGRRARQMERDLGIADRVQPGPADSAIYDENPGETSPADSLARHGIKFTRADKSAGSVKRGCDKVREMLEEARKPRPEDPGMWVTDRCRQFIRTVPTLPRSETDPDVYDTDAEDHIADEVRYIATSLRPPTQYTTAESPWG